jgi:glycosyltransferase involved in cell wall biosynthesis
MKAFSIIVPVHNEASVLRHTQTHILDGLNPGALLIYVCNGCSDKSAEILRSMAGNRAIVLETASAGKPNAIRLGEKAAGGVFPRFYVDADVTFEGAKFDLLAKELRDEVELVSPRNELDTQGCSFAARSIASIWSSLPFFVDSSFRAVIGVSQSGRSRWGDLPDVMADDTYMAMQVPSQNRKIIRDVASIERVPRNFWSFVGVRARWIMGDRELLEKGYTLYGVQQRSALLSLLKAPATTIRASIYLAHRLCASLLVKWWLFTGKKTWFRDQSSRHVERS